MSAGVFVLKDDKTLVAMRPAEFVKEHVFQTLLADFPELLLGDQMDSAAPRRWTLVQREKTIPSEDGGPGRWAVDHLFLDQDGIPTLVEVKRHTDTRIRCEVIGQMLDYAANGVVYWPADELRSAFATTCASRPDRQDPDAEIRKLVGPNSEPEAFWERVKTNLQEGRIRMLFVADEIPQELRRVVEFLNTQMDRAEVLAIEIRQYEGEGGLKALVPVIFGQTEEAQQKKTSSSQKRHWSEDLIYEDMDRRAGGESVKVAKKLAEWMKAKADQHWFGSGLRDGAMCASFERNGLRFFPIQFSSNGRLAINFGYILKPPFDDQEKRLEFLKRINEAGELNLADEVIDRYPSVPLTILSNDARLDSFLSAMDWFVSQLPARS